MSSLKLKYILSVGVALLMVTGFACSDTTTGTNGNGNGDGTPTPTPTPTPEPELIFEDMFVSTVSIEDSVSLSEHTSTSGHSWGGGMIQHWYIDGANNYAAVGFYPMPNPSMAVAQVNPESPNYSAEQLIIPFYVDPGTQNVRAWHSMWISVRHDGMATPPAPDEGEEPEDGDTGYYMHFAGEMEGVKLIRRNNGVPTVLAHDDEYTAVENDVVPHSEIMMKIEAKTVGDDVILNGWISVDDGDVHHAFVDFVDDSEDRILDAGNPAYGSSSHRARLIEVEAWSVIVEEEE